MFDGDRHHDVGAAKVFDAVLAVAQVVDPHLATLGPPVV